MPTQGPPHASVRVDIIGPPAPNDILQIEKFAVTSRSLVEFAMLAHRRLPDRGQRSAENVSTPFLAACRVRKVASQWNTMGPNPARSYPILQRSNSAVTSSRLRLSDRILCVTLSSGTELCLKREPTVGFSALEGSASSPCAWTVRW